MNRLPLLGLLWGVGCDIPTDGLQNSLYASTTDTAALPTPPRTDSGTQLGSEGFWGCPIEKVGLISDGTLEIDDLGGSPSAMTADRIGIWPIDIVDNTGKAVLGTVTLRQRDTLTYQWVEVEGTAGCVDQLAASVEGVLERPDLTTVVVGFVAMTKDATRLLVTSEAEVVDLSAWGTPSYADPSPATFRVFGDMSTDWLTGEASFVDCPRTEVVCETAEVVASVSATR